jgi:hypothetical protein
MRKKLLFGLAVVAALVFAVAGVVVAQDTEEEVDAEVISLTGCLVEVEEGEYILRDAESGEEIDISGEGVGDHAGHKVTITGMWAEDEDGNEYFEVDAVKHLDTSCS